VQLKALGADLSVCVNQSITRGWADVFLPKVREQNTTYSAKAKAKARKTNKEVSAEDMDERDIAKDAIDRFIAMFKGVHYGNVGAVIMNLGKQATISPAQSSQNA
uniref:hypothetical protein n=1 Tax=Helicobacter suis TaxID=104628 RepID=UPI0013D10841